MRWLLHRAGDVVVLLGLVFALSVRGVGDMRPVNVGRDAATPTRLHTVGKIFATAAIAWLGAMHDAAGNVAIIAITLIWLVTIPALVEAFYLAKYRRWMRLSEQQQQIQEELTDD